MPYISKAQEAYFNAHRKELEAQGVNVDEWNAASEGKDLPEHAARDHKAKKHEFAGDHLAHHVSKSKK